METTDTPNKSVSSNKTPTKKMIKLPSADNLFVSADRLMSELTKLPRREDDVYLAGDLVWVKTKGFPWWPTLITVDPESGKYSKNFVIRDKNDKAFHVQYFGSKAYRGYTQGNIMKYDGKEKYELKLDQIRNTPTPNKSQRKMELNNYEIKPTFRKDWNLACDQADEAMKLDRAVRIETLTFEYIVDKQKTGKKKAKLSDDESEEIPKNKSTSTKKSTESKSTSKKRKANDQPASSKLATSHFKSITSQSAKRQKKKSAAASPTDVYDFNEFADEFQEDIVTPKKPFELSSAKRAKGEYHIYAKQLRADIEKENPEFDEDQVEAKLKRNWELMSEDMKNGYAPRLSLFQNNSSFQLDSPNKSLNDADIPIPDLNNSTSKSANKRQKTTKKSTASDKKSVEQTKTKTYTGSKRGRKPKNEKTIETNNNDFEKENENEDEIDKEDNNQVVEENSKNDDEQEVAVTNNRRSSRKKLFNEGNKTNESINENKNTPTRQSARMRTHRPSVDDDDDEEVKKPKTPKQQSIKSTPVKTPSSTTKVSTPSTKTPTRRSSRHSIGNGDDQVDNNIKDKDEQDHSDEDNKSSTVDIKTTNKTPVTRKNSINSKKEIIIENNSEETNGGLSEDSDELDTESDKAKQQKEINEENKTKHCSKCLEVDKVQNLIGCDGDCLSLYHKECLHQTSS